MDWTKISRKAVEAVKPSGAYTNLEDLIRIQFNARDFSLRPQQPVTSILSGRYASRLRGRGLNFEELRRYQPGDDIRTIDWKVTARTRDPYVRVYSEEKDRQVLLVVDQRINMFFGTKQKMKSVTAAEVAALGAWRAVDVGDRVGAVVFNDTDVDVIRPQRSKETVMRILRSVVQKNHQLRADSDVESNPGMLNDALRKAAHVAPHDVLVVLISDADGVNDETDRLVAKLAAGNDVIGILVIDPSRLDPASERITVSDGHSQMEVNFGDRKISDRFVEDARAEIDRMTHYLRRLSAPLLMVSNQGDTVGQIRKLLGVPVRGK